MTDYASYIAAKAVADRATGFEPRPLTAPAFDFQRDCIHWALRRGRAAFFQDCGLGKTLQELEWANQVALHTGKPSIIFTPLAVTGQFVQQGQKFGIPCAYREHEAQILDGDRIIVTNYGKQHRFKPESKGGVAWDESSIFKSKEGKTFAAACEAYKQVEYRLCATATPSPNDYMELGNHAQILGVMSMQEMLAMFFTHDGSDTSQWRLKGHAQDEFWKWLCSWAVNIRRPSDLGYSDDGFVLPELCLTEHIVEAGKPLEGFLIPMPASSMSERRQARKESLDERVEKSAEIANSNDEQWLIWCNLNDESVSLTKAIKGAVEVRGSDSDDVKEKRMRGFEDGTHRALITKPSIAGFGMNWQHAHNMAFTGLSDSYEQFYQAVRREWRFGQKEKVNAHIIISSLEGAVLNNIKRKEADANRMAAEMVKHMQDISSLAIRGQERTQTNYTPQEKLQLPSFV